jgi:Arc/MetJ-type ribon-helix-helix transcriptional regulator
MLNGMATIQIAVRLSEELLATVDELIAEGTVESRADAVRRGLEMVVDQAERVRIDRALIAGYRRLPPTADEEAAARAALRAAIEDEPW